jgi:hypothetical protein
LAADTHSLDVTAKLAPILNQDTAFWIRLGPLDLHRLNTSNASDEVCEEAFLFFLGLER